MTVSPFDHPYLSGLLGDEEIAAQFSVVAEIEAMLAFERALAEVEAVHGLIPAAAAERIAEAVARFAPDVSALRTATQRDGVVVPELVRQLRAAVGDDHGAHVHFGATSQDVVDTGFMLRASRIAHILLGRVMDLVDRLNGLADRFGANSLMGKTRMQAAIEISAADRIAAWRQPLERHVERLKDLLANGFALQFGGAAGTLEKLGLDASAVRAGLANALGLVDAPQWQSQRDRVAELAGVLSMITGSLGKIGQDLALMALEGGEVTLSGGGGSSAMPHKQNPVAAEVLVTLARFNATLLAGAHQALVHEQERSGSAWTLEWLILPQMAVCTGASMRRAEAVLSAIESFGVAKADS
ncbi:3-carboxy-cis,cis-muconate cycloisomerase [Sinorhizobium sp. BG8]|uniref:3-carboxy-cis,cis-muconate cycloisomerase n=1 Tax=Sinorhizobium sp. BG8 TaxID=2613773 RepID=UPI00193CFD4E|nr:3-carboxy-cis,cis-muconate cycloisomerase [Sinorhizobium sp. BG8]QRM53951.1 3-carboxy-cis,cis-muconate cycloisomerase [Sinorhizobium sp. BG8]